MFFKVATSNMSQLIANAIQVLVVVIYENFSGQLIRWTFERQHSLRYITISGFPQLESTSIAVGFKSIKACPASERARSLARVGRNHVPIRTPSPELGTWFHWFQSCAVGR